MAKIANDLPLVLPYQSGPTEVAYPCAEGQTPDQYPRTYTRVLKDLRANYRPRLHERTSWPSGLTYTDDFANAAWSTKTNVTATANLAANPNDGQLTGSRLLETSATDEHKVSRSFTFTATSHALTVFAQHLGRDWLRILANDGTEDFEYWVNLASGATKPFADLINGDVNNGGMETAGSPLGSWTAITGGGTSAVVRDTSVFDAGAAAARFDVDGSGNFAGLSRTILQAGRRYRLVLRAKNGGAGTLIVWRGSTAAATQALTGTFTSYSFEFTADGSAFELYSQTAGASVWVDGVVLTPLEPAALILGSLGNGDMETSGSPLGSWTAITGGGTSAVVRDTSVFDAGAASARFDVDGSGNFAGLSRTILQTGRRYRLVLRAKNGGAGTLIVWRGSTAAATQVLTGTFASYSFEFTADGSMVQLYSQTAGASVWVDNVALVPLDVPACGVQKMAAPGDAWWRLALVAPWVRAAAGTITFALSADGTNLSYAGDTAKGVYLWRANCRPGTVTTLGPAVPSLGTARTISAPDLDPDDCFAYLAAESEPAPVPGDRVRVERTFARIPGPQTSRDYQAFARPDMSGLRSGSVYAACLDPKDAPQRTNHLWSSRKAISGALTVLGSSIRHPLPSGTVTFTLSDATFTSFAANASEATVNAALSLLVGPGKLNWANCAKHPDGANLTLFWEAAFGGPYFASITVPAGVAPAAIVGNQAQLTANGTTVTPDTKLVTCPAHGAVLGLACAIWNGTVLVATGSVAGITDSDNLSLVISDLTSPDFNFTHLTFADLASFRYAVGSKDVLVRIVKDSYLPGVTMLPDGTILADLDSLPDVTTYTSPQAWLDRLVAAATYVPINASAVGRYLGPIATRDTVSVRMSSALESLSLT